LKFTRQLAADFNKKSDSIPSFVDAAGLADNVSALIDNAAAKAHGSVEYASGAAEDALERAKPALEKAANMAHLAVETAADKVAQPAQWLAQHGEELQVKQQKLVGDARGYVTAHPLKSLAIALVAGIVLGRLVL
jgi:ElaB/YqjD/DUF883 family membrane-anchored ribosome-binding protein